MTNTFVSESEKGIELITKKYEKNSKNITLCCTTHMALPSFYESINKELSKTDVVLLEGFNPDKQKNLTCSPSTALLYATYANLAQLFQKISAKSLNLMAEVDYPFTFSRTDISDLNSENNIEIGESESDIFSLIEQIHNFSNLISIVFNAKPQSEELKDFYNKLYTSILSKTYDIGLNEINKEREKIITQKIDYNLEKYDFLGIKYGLAHCKPIENYLISEEFKIVNASTYLLIPKHE